MKLTGKIKEWIAGFRHKRGFGIHSPFAYRFITETLHQEHGYYAYRRLSTDNERLVFRISLAIRPATVAILGMPSARQAVKFAMPMVRFVDPENAEMIIAMGKVDIAIPNSDKQSFPHLVLLDNNSGRTRRLWKETMTFGMTFDNCHSRFVAVAKHSLPRQDFSVRF